MDKQELKQSQPVVWKMLSQALLSGRLAHAYLFYGPKGSPKSQMALLFAQSLFCEHPDEDGFACQECAVCHSLQQEEEMDFYWMHPGGIRQKNRLSRKELDAVWKNPDTASQDEKPAAYKVLKSSILNLQDAFGESSINGSRQVYILEQYDTATPEASNSLLKFMEEPHEDLIGILCADDLGNVLPTIQSRCQLIPFRPASVESLKDELRECISDEESLDMLARAGWRKEEAEQFDEHFDQIKAGAKSYCQDMDRQEGILNVQLNLFTNKNTATRTNVLLFLQWVLYDMKKQLESDPEQSLAIRSVLLESMDRLKRPVDILLLLDHTMYEILKIRTSRLPLRTPSSR